MPPYFMVHDGSCGSFDDAATLTDDQKATIVAWADGGARRGDAGDVTLPAKPDAGGAVDRCRRRCSRPTPQGGQLAEYDEYRCFLLDTPGRRGRVPDRLRRRARASRRSFITSIGFVVDPQAVIDTRGTRPTPR